MSFYSYEEQLSAYFDYSCEFDSKFGLVFESKMAEIEIALENRGVEDEG